MNNDFVTDPQSTTINGINFHFGISLVILAMMSLVRLSMAILKNRSNSVVGNNNDMNINGIIRHQGNVIMRFSVIMTIIGTCFTCNSLDSSINSLYRWLFSVFTSVIIEILTAVVVAVVMRDIHIRETFATRIFENHRKFFIFACILLFISGGLFFYKINLKELQIKEVFYFNFTTMCRCARQLN
jgi:hypothetical protein